MSQARENSSAFIRCLKVEDTTMHLISRGRLFQALDPVIENHHTYSVLNSEWCSDNILSFHNYFTTNLHLADSVIFSILRLSFLMQLTLFIRISGHSCGRMFFQCDIYILIET